MRRLSWYCAAALTLIWSGSAALAEQVRVEGVHICCGMCVKALNAAFEGVEGVSNVAVDKDAGAVTYDAADAKTARAGLQALAKAGFAGKAKFGDRDLNFPKGYKEEATGDSVTIRGVHNCCNGCKEALVSCLKGVKGVTNVECDKRVCTVTGSGVSHAALIEALHADGFHGNIGAADAGGSKQNKTE